MSSEPDYNFNPPATSNAESLSLHLPFALLTAAIAVILVAQTVNTFKQKSALSDGKKQLISLYHSREGAVENSKKIQAELQSLVLDLITLAKTDEDAKAIVGKYGIQQAGTPSSPMPADAAEPAK